MLYTPIRWRIICVNCADLAGSKTIRGGDRRVRLPMNTGPADAVFLKAGKQLRLPHKRYGAESLGEIMRRVFPEILDSLAHDDPAAIQSRAELRLINRIMGNHRWLIRELSRRLDRMGNDTARVLELGAGDGGFAEQVWQSGTVSAERWEALDLAPAPPEWPAGASWHRGDLFESGKLPEVGVIVANLFLHHFERPQLERLGGLIPESCRVLIACEPARRLRHRIQGRMLSALLGFGEVTHHDMLVSIQAGFLGNELSDALRLDGWNSEVSLTLLGAYRFVAWR